MSRKDFILIAETIYNLDLQAWATNDNRRFIAEQFADALATTNPQFKRELFIQAATGKVALTARAAR